MYFIIANPVAGKKKGKRNLEKVKRIFDGRGVSYSVFETTRAGEATELAVRLTSDRQSEEGSEALSEAAVSSAVRADEPIGVIVIGGDGTLHEVLNGISDFGRCRLGLIPSGTGNDFAEAAGIPLDAETAAKLILDGEAKETDFLDVGGVRCMNVGGMGMDVDVLVRCKKGRIFKGKIKYLLSLLQSLFSFKGCEISVESDGLKETRNALLAVACNGRQIGGGIRICPVSVVDDGRIDVVTVDCMGKIQILKAFFYLMKGRALDYPAAKHFLCDRVKFSPKTPCTVQLDGELYDGLDFDVQIRKGLKIYR